MFTPPWFQPFIWLDYRLAFIFTVIVPMVLLIWALIKKVPVAIDIMMIYWRVASLLGITICLIMGGSSLAFFSALAAKILIPLSLWFWVDINEEINDLPPKAIKLALTAWRWTITTYCTLGAIFLLPFMQCGLLAKSNFCRAWFQQPLQYPNFLKFLQTLIKPETLGAFGIAALIFYALCFGYFLVVRLGKQGRMAIDN
jgi:Protein of unknown function (DUF3177)